MSIVDNLDLEELIKIITDDNTPDRILMEIASDSGTPPFLLLYLFRRADLPSNIISEVINRVTYSTPDKILIAILKAENLNPDDLLELISKEKIELNSNTLNAIISRSDIFSERMAKPFGLLMKKSSGFRYGVARNTKATPRILNKVIDYIVDNNYPLTTRNSLLKELVSNPNLAEDNIQRLITLDFDLLTSDGVNLTLLAINKNLNNDMFEDLLNMATSWEKIQLINDYWDSSFINKLHLSPDPEIREAYSVSEVINFNNLVYLLDDPDRSVRQAATNVVLDDIAEYPKEIQERLLPVIKRNSDTKLKEDFPNLSLKSDASNKNHPDLELLKRLKGHLNSHA